MRPTGQRNVCLSDRNAATWPGRIFVEHFNHDLLGRIHCTQSKGLLPLRTRRPLPRARLERLIINVNACERVRGLGRTGHTDVCPGLYRYFDESLCVGGFDLIMYVGHVDGFCMRVFAACDVDDHATIALCVFVYVYGCVCVHVTRSMCIDLCVHMCACV
jgi:hypothetical protein